MVSVFCPMHNVPETGPVAVLTVKGDEACDLYPEDGSEFSFRNVVFQLGAFAHSQKAPNTFVTSLTYVPSSAFINLDPNGRRVTRCCSWLRHYAISRRVAGSIPDDVTGIFH